MSDVPNAHEHLERVEHHVEADATVPLSIAIMAVFAAVLGSLEAASAAHAVVARSSAAIRQGEATDAWSFYQATSIKKNMYELFAQNGGPNAEGQHQKAAKYTTEQADIERDARAKEARVHESEMESEAAMERHHHLIIATNLIHLAIALASVSMLMRRRWLWFGSLGCVAAGVGVGIWSMLV